MRILTVNSGGSSIKYELFVVHESEVSLLRGNVKRLYRQDSLLEQKSQYSILEKRIPNLDHEKGLHAMLEALIESGCLKSLSELDAIGIKLINGGKKIQETCLIDEAVLEVLQDFSLVTPVHNPPAIRAIDIFRRTVPHIPLVGVFETTFHTSIPSAHRTFGLPWSLSVEYGLEKLGFHGNSYRYIAERLKHLTPFPSKIVACHLGSGCSVCAIKDGKSFDISSSFTPQSGVIMSTRPGDFDPQVLLYLQEKAGLSPKELSNLLAKESGLFGISGISGEMWEIEKAAQEGNQRAQLTIEVFVYQVKKYIGGFAALMGGLEALVFTGGIGENDAFIREKICDGLHFLGIVIDPESNKAMVKGKEGKISCGPCEVWVIPTWEELMIAREVANFLRKAGKTQETKRD
ncbi:acetate/propionate family kinase [Candidatus Caldatribacterium sp.]|uniref:acetate/propionate family kinase n=1 Tax=Candidatus Caldatribacterium sp. TaxID=2282143 RepID=UPI002991A0EE|nr:acetate/propionate family kinase [Candidatus Caldatribacterium sp.]MDW8080838.1 acetate/propionate family kinase [Candidatus Calescibacterium sp.]